VIRGFMIRAGYPEEQINAFEGQITAKLGEGHDTHTSAPAPEPDQIVVCPQSCVCKPGNCKHKLPHKYSEGCNEGSDTKCDVCSDCSSPHTPAPGKPRPPCEECVYQARSVEHDAQVAKAEREQIIKELESWNPFQRTFGNVLEALRQPEPQQEGRR